MADLTKIDLNAPTQNVVPFGKYKGRSIVELQQTDPGYLQWLVTQDWFREKFITLHQTIINHGGEPSETPEHNWYQALFLDEKFAAAVFDARLPGGRTCGALRQREWRAEELREKIKNAEYYLRHKEAFSHLADPDKLNQLRNKLSDIEGKATQPIQLNELAAISVEFEARGADVQMSAAYGGLDVRVEIKPAMGDDYPAVLRQMKGACCDTLYLVNYTGEGATLEQVKKIFKASGIVVLMHVDFAKYIAERSEP